MINDASDFRTIHKYWGKHVREPRVVNHGNKILKPGHEQRWLLQKQDFTTFNAKGLGIVKHMILAFPPEPQSQHCVQHGKRAKQPLQEILYQNGNLIVVEIAQTNSFF